MITPCQIINLRNCKDEISRDSGGAKRSLQRKSLVGWGWDAMQLSTHIVSNLGRQLWEVYSAVHLPRQVFRQPETYSKNWHYKRFSNNCLLSSVRKRRKMVYIVRLKNVILLGQLIKTFLTRTIFYIVLNTQK